MNKISSYTMLEILKSAGVKTAQTGGNIVCNCPICKPGQDFRRGEHNAQVNTETLHCFSEDKTYTRTQIIDSLDLYGTLDITKWDDRPSAVPQIKQSKPAAVDGDETIIKQIIFEYRNLYGKVLYKKERIDYIRDGKPGKRIFYKNKAKDQPVIFYGLETLANPDNINFIMFAEGEKCVESLRTALLNTKAAQNTAIIGLVKASEWESIGKTAQDIILGKTIIIFQDNDQPGQFNTAELLKFLGKSAQVVDFADKEKGYDIADWLEDGGTIESAMRKYAKEIDFKDNSNDDPDAVSASLITPVKPEFILVDYMPLVKNDVNMLAAFGGTGKTWIALNCALKAAESGMKVKYWIREATAGYLRYRLDELLNFYPNMPHRIIQNIFFSDVQNDFNFKLNAHYDFVILDPYLSFFTGDDENSNKQNRKFIEPFIHFSAERKTTFLFVHHAGKNKDAEYQARGASAIIDTMHNVWEVERLNDSISKCAGFDKHTQRVIKNKKDNMGVGEGKELTIVIKPRLEDDNSYIENEQKEEEKYEEVSF